MKTFNFLFIIAGLTSCAWAIKEEKLAEKTLHDVTVATEVIAADIDKVEEAEVEPVSASSDPAMQCEMQNEVPIELVSKPVPA